MSAALSNDRVSFVSVREGVVEPVLCVPARADLSSRDTLTSEQSERLDMLEFEMVRLGRVERSATMSYAKAPPCSLSPSLPLRRSLSNRMSPSGFESEAIPACLSARLLGRRSRTSATASVKRCWKKKVPPPPKTAPRSCHFDHLNHQRLSASAFLRPLPVRVTQCTRTRNDRHALAAVGCRHQDHLHHLDRGRAAQRHQRERCARRLRL